MTSRMSEEESLLESQRTAANNASANPSSGSNEPGPSTRTNTSESTQPAASAAGDDGGGGDANGMFECNICLETVEEPVITVCGHLFCWSCIYQWLQRGTHQTCPVCKAGVTVESLVPLYGRSGNNEDPRKKRPANSSIPQRPQGQRPEEPPQPNRAFGGNGTIPVTFTAGFGFFPSLFASQTIFTFGGDQTPTEDMTPEMRQQVFLSKALLVVGAAVIVCLLFFEV